MKYLAGAISHDINYKEKFRFYKQKLSTLILNDIIYDPAEECELRGLSEWDECMMFNVKILQQCNWLYVIDDGIPSRGVELEVAVALSMRIPITCVKYDKINCTMLFKPYDYRRSLS